MNEIWKKVPGHENYQVSNIGRIKSTYGQIMKQQYQNDYYNIILNKKRFRSHRVVAFAFIPNPENKPCINHKNGIKTDNRVENLEWCTHSENSIHSFKIGKQCNKGESHSRAKLDNISIRVIREATSLGYKHKDIAKYFGVDRSTITLINTRKTWPHVF